MRLRRHAADGLPAPRSGPFGAVIVASRASNAGSNGPSLWVIPPSLPPGWNTPCERIAAQRSPAPGWWLLGGACCDRAVPDQRWPSRRPAAGRNRPSATGARDATNHSVARRVMPDVPAGIAPETAPPGSRAPGASQPHPRDDTAPPDEPRLASMEFRNFAATSHERIGIDIPNAGCSRRFTPARVADLRRHVASCTPLPHLVKGRPLDPDQCCPGDVAVQLQRGREAHRWSPLMSPLSPNLSARY